MSGLARGLASAVLVGFAVLTCLLGRWQLHRLAARRSHNAAMLAASHLPALELPTDLARVGNDSGRRVVAHGHFVAESAVLVRSRVENDQPGLFVVNRFVLDSSHIVWVLRGFVAAADAATPPADLTPPDTGATTITGEAFPLLPAVPNPLTLNGRLTLMRLDRITLQRVDERTLPYYVWLTDDPTSAGRLPRVTLPPLTNGPHLSYAIQWFGMALAAITGAVLILVRGGRELPRPRAAP